MRVHESAYRHGVDDEAIRHVVDFALTIIELAPDEDPRKILAIGPDPAGNLFEVIWLELESDDLVIHAMALRRAFYDLLPDPEDHDG